MRVSSTITYGASFVSRVWIGGYFSINVYIVCCLLQQK